MTEEPFDLAHWERLRSQVRARIAELLSVGPESITFTKNTTAGLGLVAAGLEAGFEAVPAVQDPVVVLLQTVLPLAVVVDEPEQVAGK